MYIHYYCIIALSQILSTLQIISHLVGHKLTKWISDKQHSYNIYIYIYIYIYSHPQTDLFRSISVARQARFTKLGSKPGWLKRQSKILPLNHEETSASGGNLSGYESQLLLFIYIYIYIYIYNSYIYMCVYIYIIHIYIYIYNIWVGSVRCWWVWKDDKNNGKSGYFLLY